nr:LysE family translocator [Pseudovibrio flavus]
MITPGPNMILIIGQSLSHGFSAGLLTVVGATIAQLLQIIVVTLGLGWVVQQAPLVFEAIRYGGAAYLLYLGITALLKKQSIQKPALSGSRHFAGGFLVGLSNPKTLIFLAALFPQFMTTSLPAEPQLTILAVTYLALAFCIDSVMALASASARSLAEDGQTAHILQKISGVVLIAAATMLLAFT